MAMQVATAIGIVVFILIADQASKALMIRVLQPRGMLLSSRVGLRLVRNPRPGLGLIRGKGPLLATWILASAGALLAAIVWFAHDPMAQAGLAVAVGGAAGNLLDVLRRGAVVDFVDLRFWPVFNLADVAITAGLAVVGLRAVAMFLS